jgi:transposase
MQALRDGAPVADAAARFGVSRSTAERLGDPAAAAERRQRLIDDVLGGASLGDAAAHAGVSASTAARWARRAGAEVARQVNSARRRDEALAMAAIEGGMSVEEAAARFALTAPAVARLIGRPRLAPERLARRRQLFEAIASGLSCRKAAARVGLPVATAIRWARRRDGGPLARS